MPQVWFTPFRLTVLAGSLLLSLFLALTAFPLPVGPASAESSTVSIDVRVWQDLDDARNIFISARPAGGSWRTLGTVRLPLDDGHSFDNRYRYGDVALDLPSRSSAPFKVDLRVSQGTANGRNVFVGARAPDESWLRVGMIALPLDDGFSSNGYYRYSDIQMEVPLSSAEELAACSNGIVVEQPERQPQLVRDCAVLLQERDVLTGDGDGLNWSADRPIGEWLGITVSGQPSRVVGISVRSLLRGRIPPGLARLDRLQSLSLYDNELTGEIPSEIGLLSDLRSIDFSFANLSGRIPPELGQLSELRQLWLYDNQLEGEIPTEVASLRHLWFVDLRANRLSGAIPIEFGRPGLGILYLGGNRLGGEIPAELELAGSLTALGLGDNMLTGEIPPALATLRHLEFLWLNNNQLSGGVPAALGDLSQLLELSLYNNQLTGEIPPEVAALPNLKRIGFFNNQLTGCVPIGLWSKLASVHHDDGTPVGAVALPWCDAVQVQVAVPPLNPTLIEACASGAVLASLSQSQGLLNDCAALLEAKPILEGKSGDLNWAPHTPIGEWTGLWLGGSNERVSGLWLNDSELGGRVPAVLANLTKLEYLWFRNNELGGEIPTELAHLQDLTQLDLARNQITGAIPAELGALKSLRELSLSENQLSGNIPAALGQLDNLRGLFLDDNRLAGEIPAALARLDRPRLDLRGNQLSGSIPAAFAEVTEPWQWKLWLGGNLFSGCLPNRLGPQVVDLEATGLAYCECPANWQRGSGYGPRLSRGADGILWMQYLPIERPGPHRISYQLVVDLPEGGEFGLRSRYRTEEGRILARITERKSDSRLIIDPFSGAEFERSVTEGPTDCEVTVSELFDQIVGSARIQPLDLPLAANGYPTMDLLQPVEGGRTYNIEGPAYLVVDVPEGMRLTLDFDGEICQHLDGCFSILRLTDESSGSFLTINGSTGAERRRVMTDEADRHRVGGLFDILVASIRREEPPYLRPSCENPPTADDCAALLTAVETLVVEADLNWSAERRISDWKGVTVDRWTGRVVAVRLSNLDLDGQVAAALGRLTALEALQLSGNDLTGTIPPELGRLARLKRLSLGNNELTGEIPAELGNLRELEELFLYGNSHEGCIPAGLERFSFTIHDFSNPGLRYCNDDR